MRVLAQLHRLGVLENFDLGWAAMLERRNGGPLPPGLAEAAALLTALQRRGHTCLDLDAAPEEWIAAAWNLEPALLPPFSKDWKIPDEHLPILGKPGACAPLIRDGRRLYLQRYWRAQAGIAAALLDRAIAPAEAAPSGLLNAIDRCWSKPEEADQRRAARMVVERRVAVVSGGPGTGKTSCVAAAVRMWLEASAPRLRVAIVAPTGRAVARLKAVWRDIGGPTEAIEASTLHRCLGLRPTPTRVSARRSLRVDMVVVDEMSMVDLELMSELADAVPTSARLVLVGDRDQLASVQPGGVFRDLCEGLERRGPSAPLVTLEHNFRFRSDSGIARFAEAVRVGDTDAALAVLQSPWPDLAWRPLPSTADFGERLRRRMREAWTDLFEAPDAHAALAALRRFRVLTSHRIGPWGADRIAAESAKLGAGLDGPRAPLIITANDVGRGLFNGDGGVWWRGADGREAVIENGEGIVRLPAGRLPPHEPAWALTVHKSQGSEFDEVLLVLPDRDSPLLTRELLYTAATRARRRLEIWAPLAEIAAAARRPTRRDGGLADALAAGSTPAVSGEPTSLPSRR